MISIMSRRNNASTVTLADFLAIPEEDRFHELLDGEIIRKASPSGAHGGVQAELLAVLVGLFGRPAGGEKPGGWWFAAEVEIQLGNNVCRPDLVAWRRDRVPNRPCDPLVKVVPDWAGEILSTNRGNDLVRKKHLYHRHQVPHYWIVDPADGTLAVYRWQAEGYLEVVAAERGDRVRAEPFDRVELTMAALLGDDEEI